MGASPNSLLMSLDLKGMVLETKDRCNPSGSLWMKVLETKAKRTRRLMERRRRRRQRVFMKRRVHLVESSRRPTSGIQTRVRTLKKLLPNSGSIMGLDGLFTETADYILSLQMTIKVMNIMVKVLSHSDN